MDPVLSSLFPVNQIGSDGFQWWIGQIETSKNDDPKISGRYRVRIVGQHLKDCDSTPTEELPWAHVVMPVTTPFTDGLTTGASIGLSAGNWVVGFYMDAEKQKPIIMGSIGHTKASTIIKNVDPNPGSTCKSFTTFISTQADPKTDWPINAQSGTNKEKANVVSAAEPSASYGTKSGEIPPAIAALFQERSETNPIGGKTTYAIADPKCGSDTNFKTTLTRIIGDLLKANQQSGGRLGDYMVGKFNGQLYKYINIGRYHVGRVVRLTRSFMARIKGEIVKLLRDGIQKLIDAIILFDDPNGKIIGNTGPLKDPEKAFKPIREKGNRLKKIKEIFDKIFAELGCTIADASETIAKWIFDLLFGFLSDVFYQASCFVETLVEGILSQILSVLENLISTVLAPLQQLLSVLANPLNIVGTAINRVMTLLGISCSGPNSKCDKSKEISTSCEDNDDDDKDFLDKLIKDVENGPLDYNKGICNEAKNVPPEQPTVVAFVGGVFATPPKARKSRPPGTTEGNTPASFFPEPYDEENDSLDSIFEQLIPPENPFSDSFNPDRLPPATPNVTLEVPSPELPEETNFITIATDKNIYFEGETITYTVSTVGIEDDTVFSYVLSGVEITDDDIVEGLTGEFTILNGTATFQVTIAEDNVVEITPEYLTLSIVDTQVQISVIIDSTFEVVPGINDDVILNPTYLITTDKQTYVEGEDIIYTISTENIADGTEFQYSLIGADITPSDIIGNSLTGNFIVNNNRAEVVVGINNDIEIEANEVLTFVINGTGAFANVTILESFLTSEEEEEELDEPKINKPVAGTPITDEDGSIISIPIVNPGDPYQTEPNVIIGGKGYGATAIALLDENGFVSEIRVTRTGVNYKINTPDNENLTCVIDSFTLIKPGVGYTSSPEVFIDGDNTLAQALINEDGFVYSVVILDRSKTYTSIPTIEIVGGGGAGAKVFPNITCLDQEDLELKGYAKIGTGKYIDCP